MSTVFHHNEGSSSASDDDTDDLRTRVKVKASQSNKGPYDFDLLVPVQDLPRAHNVTRPYPHVESFREMSQCFNELADVLGSSVDDGVLALWQVVSVWWTRSRVEGVGAQRLPSILPTDAR